MLFQKVESDSSKDEVDLLGDLDMGEIFSGSHEELRKTARQIYSSPPQTQHLGLEALSLKTLQPVPPTPGTVVQKKIEKLLGS